MTLISAVNQYCPKCKEDVPVEAYTPSKQGKRGSYCRECAKKSANESFYRNHDHALRTRQAWYQRNKDSNRETVRRWREANPRKHRANRLRDSGYNITIDEYEAMQARQAGHCAVCGRIPSYQHKGKQARLHVDHNHITGKVRGLLCSPCNTALGLLGDDKETLTKMLEYLIQDGLV